MKIYSMVGTMAHALYTFPRNGRSKTKSTTVLTMAVVGKHSTGKDPRCL